MAKRISILVLFGILVISVWVLGSAIQAGAETMKCKVYTWVVKVERGLVGDVEGHTLSLSIRRAFYVFENGEIATSLATITSDLIKGSGTNFQYRLITFTDGSTIVVKQAGIVAGSAVGVTTSSESAGEIIKGTGRFEGIKGTQTVTTKYLPLEKGEEGTKGYGESTFNYTLPSK